MGLESIVANTMIRVRADTSDARAQIKMLRGEERAAAQARLGEMDATNRGIDKQIAMWGKIALGVGASVAAYKMAQAAAKAYLEDLRLESAAAGANIDGLRKATLGLIEADDLLKFAGKAQNGVWKLNQQEMETVLKGATALRKTMGVELQPTIEALTDAVAKGSTRALKEFGIAAKDKQGVLRELDKIVGSMGGSFKMAGDDMQASGVKIADTFDDLQGALGKFVMTLEPAARVLAGFVGWLSKAERLTDYLAGVDTRGGSREEKWRREAAEMRERAAAMRGGRNSFSDMALSGDTSGASAAGLEAMAAELERKAAERGHQLAVKSASQFGKSFSSMLFAGDGSAVTSADYWKMLKGINTKGASSGKRDDVVGSMGWALPSADLSALYGQASGAASSLAGSARGYHASSNAAAADAKQKRLLSAVADIDGKRIAGEAKQGQNRTYLETVFGTSAEIDAMTESLKVASTVFGGLTEAVTAGFDAWITGQGSVVSAFNKAIGEMLRSLAKQMAVEALKHTAMGIGAMAFGPIGGVSAGMHFAAAGKFAAVAAAAGVAAKGVGGATGQWSQGAGGGGGGGSSPSRTISNRSATGGEGNAPITIYVGAEWAAMSKIESAAAIQRAIRLGKRGNRHTRRGS